MNYARSKKVLMNYDIRSSLVLMHVISSTCIGIYILPALRHDTQSMRALESSFGANNSCRHN
jgi:hypothetical protein